MTYSPQGYLARADECVRLANLTKDEMLQTAILRLRQSYLQVAESFARPTSSGEGPGEDSAPPAIPARR